MRGMAGAPARTFCRKHGERARGFPLYCFEAFSIGALHSYVEMGSSSEGRFGCGTAAKATRTTMTADDDHGFAPSCGKTAETVFSAPV
jgi:hypothetical protein